MKTRRVECLFWRWVYEKKETTAVCSHDRALISIVSICASKDAMKAVPQARNSGYRDAGPVYLLPLEMCISKVSYHTWNNRHTYTAQLAHTLHSAVFEGTSSASLLAL